MPHTPGPWRIGSVANEVFGGRASRRKPIATTAPSTEGFADARLIAAAPDLLKIAEDVVALTKDERGGLIDPRTLQRALAAIAKAVG